MGKLTRHFLTKVAVSFGIGILYAGVDYYINDENSLIGEIKKARKRRKLQKQNRNGPVVLDQKDFSVD